MCIKFTADVTFRCNFQHQWKLIDIYRFCLWCDHELDICCSSDDDGREFFPKIHWISLFRSWDFVQLKIPPVSKFAAGLVWNYATPSVSFGYIIVIVLLALQLQLIPVMHPSMFMNWTVAVISYVNNNSVKSMNAEAQFKHYGQRRQCSPAWASAYWGLHVAIALISFLLWGKPWVFFIPKGPVVIYRTFSSLRNYCTSKMNKQTQESDLRKKCTFRQSNRVI